MNETTERVGLPLPTIGRYPAYLRSIRASIAGGETYVTAARLAQEIAFDPVMTRKDLAMSGVVGTPRLGYPARELEAAMTALLGWDGTTEAALVGAGSLGNALLGYQGFAEQHLSISVAFDAAPALQGLTLHGVKVFAMKDLPRLIQRLKIAIGILTVPASAAQTCADQLVAAGVAGIWNFTPVKLAVPPNVRVEHVDLATSLACLSHAITADRAKK